MHKDFIEDRYIYKVTTAEEKQLKLTGNRGEHRAFPKTDRFPETSIIDAGSPNTYFPVEFSFHSYTTIIIVLCSRERTRQIQFDFHVVHN
jgi:hypothetical protein